QRKPLPAAAAIGAAKRALGRADKNDLGIYRMARDSVHLRLVGQAVCQRLPALIAGGLAKDAAASPSSRTHRTRVHVGGLGHYALQPSVATLPNYMLLSGLVTKLHQSALVRAKREVVDKGAKPRSVWAGRTRVVDLGRMSLSGYGAGLKADGLLAI